MSLTVRVAEPKDGHFVMDQIAKLIGFCHHEERFDFPNRDELWKQAIKFPKELPIFIAELEGKKVGAAVCNVHRALHFGGTVLELDDLRTEPEARNKGVGAALMKKVFEYAKDNGINGIQLAEPHPSCGYTDERQRFYDRYGFQTAGPYRFIYGLQDTAQ